MRMINYAEALEMAKVEIAREGNDFVYSNISEAGVNQCVYVRQGKPSCLVGRILVNGGIAPVEFFTELLNDDLFTSILTPLAAEGVEFTYKATRFLDELQGFQDSEYAWGDALESAVESCKNITSD